MTPLETHFLLWACSALLAILAFVGALAVKALMKMASDINEIKISVKEQSAKHDGLEKRVEIVEHKLKLS